MSTAADLRRMASRYRNLATIPTTGGHCANRILLNLGDTLERQAREIENQAADPEPD
jgi:hypothetical protein